MRAIFRSLRSRVAWLLFGIMAATTVAAVDAEFSWASLNAEQRYVLQRYRAQWSAASVAERRALVLRANAMQAAAHARRAANSPVESPVTRARPDERRAAGTAGSVLDTEIDADADTEAAPTTSATRLTPPVRPRSRSRQKRLTTAEAMLAAHSGKLRKRLREIPGVTLAERRDILARWPKLASRERMELVERYATNVTDNDELALQRELRDGSIRPGKIRWGLSTGRLTTSDLAAARRSGALSAGQLSAALVHEPDLVVGLEDAVRTGKEPPQLVGLMGEAARRTAEQAGEEPAGGEGAAAEGAKAGATTPGGAKPAP
ncbi:MAG: hypothetical protein AB7P42_07785 [Gammaproteobacteria bacterium]